MTLDATRDDLGPWRKAHLPGAEVIRPAWRPSISRISVLVVSVLLMGSVLSLCAPMASVGEAPEVTAVKAAAQKYVDELGPACTR